MDTVLDLRPLTIAELEEEYRNALASCNAVWEAQSRTTVDDGFTQEQAEEAQAQAMYAEAVKRMAWNRLERARIMQNWLANLVIPDEAEINATPLGGW